MMFYYDISHVRLKLIDFESRVLSSRATLANILTTYINRWKTSLITNKPQLYCSFNQKCIKFSVTFYQDIQNYWLDFQCININIGNATFIENQTIWNIAIDRLLYKSSFLMWNKYIKPGVVKIN